MTDNYFYEKAIKSSGGKNRARLAALAAGCVLLFAALELFALAYLRSPAVLVLGAAVPALIFLFLRKYTKTETEISVSGGVFSLSIIYGGNRRKTQASIPLSGFVYIALHDEKHIAHALEMNVTKIFYAVSENENKEKTYIAVFDLPDTAKSGKNGKMTERGLIIFECDERLHKILKNTNYHNFIC